MNEEATYIPQPGDTVRWSKETAGTTFEVALRGWKDTDGRWHRDVPPSGSGLASGSRSGEWLQVPDLPPIPERWIPVTSTALCGSTYFSHAGALDFARRYDYTGILHVMSDGTCEMLAVEP